jgi:hypothetical protein
MGGEGDVVDGDQVAVSLVEAGDFEHWLMGSIREFKGGCSGVKLNH